MYPREIKLSEPIKINGVLSDTVSIARSIRGKDLEAVESVASEIRKQLTLISRVCGLSPAEAGELAIADMLTITEQLSPKSTATSPGAGGDTSQG